MTRWDYINELIAPGENLPEILREFEHSGWERVNIDCDASGWCKIRLRRPFDMLPDSPLEPRVG
jgi:hypothetical protein